MTLLERDPTAPRSWRGDLPVTSRYTFGLAGERFFRAIKDEGRLLGTRCPHCERTYVPAMLYCERCLDQLDEWVDVGTTGEIHTFTLLFEDYDGSRLEEPQVAVFVRFGDGGLVHRMGEVAPEDVEIGMQVEAVFKPKNERSGSILDIEYFRPVTNG
jgi:uncharacterized OB-fold protein